MQTIDWDAVTGEAANLLCEYLRVDTSNPPGNESAAVAFLGQVLAAEGIPFETAESAPGRGNLIAHIGPAERRVCLLNHTDVVPVEREFWDADPFGGAVRDGAIWGRGALDMKGMGIIELMAVLLLHRRATPLRRGITFLAVADEEAGSEFGAAWLAEHRPQWLDASLVINEGAYGLSDVGAEGRMVFQVAPAEKTPVWLRLTAHGQPGHGSMPHGDNAADHLVAALGRIRAWRQDLRLTPVMRAHFEALADAGVVDRLSEQSILAMARRSISIRARMSNTVTLTSFEAGIKVNVIPAVARATLDCRLLPGEDAERFVASVRGVIGDSRVEVQVLNRPVEGPTSPMRSEFVNAVEETVRELVEGARVAPELTSGFTDSRIYRLRGIPAYGFVPCLVRPDELAGIHGHNERITVENLRLGVQVLHAVLLKLCA